ncbi:MAG: hypothetical protein QY332_06910 [Anaerolineales bacterium]|nr:MAG: hypothetical protein QY332_06910 [Anaerolineales bacterium]
MPQSEYKARQMRDKTHEVYEYDHDETKPGKPLHMLVPGGLIALAALALIVFIGYQTWFEESLTQELGMLLILILAPFYVGGVFLFSYGYELYNIPRALRLTAIIVFVTLAAVVIVAVLFFVLGNMKGGSGSSSKSSSKPSSKSTLKSSGSAKPLAHNKSGVGGVIGGAAIKKSSSSSSSPSYRSSSSGGGDVIVLGGGGRTRVETREVTKEVVREVPKEPMPITCPFCTRSYVPLEYKYICPSCGAATPKDLIEASQMRKE